MTKPANQNQASSPEEPEDSDQSKNVEQATTANDETITLKTHEKRVKRLDAARLQAEQLLEAKSAELYEIQRGMEATIEERTRALNEKVVELETLKHQIETERDTAIEESANKTTLFAKLSHEIRTPLNGIVGTLNLLSEEIEAPEPAALLGHANRACDHLKAILNDAIDLAKLENGMVTLETAPLSLSDFLEDVLYFWQLNGGEGTNRLSLELASVGISTVTLDAGRLRQVLDNFVSNALKYGGEEPIILSAQVKGSGTDATLVFSVCDGGFPLSEEDRRTIFDPYSQVGDRPTLEKIGSGAGLGLAICRELAGVMGAELVASPSAGRPGNCFSISFDLANLSPKFGKKPEAPARHVPPPKLPPKHENSSKWLVNGRAPRALIVEDVPTNQMILENYLRRWGVSAEVVENGKEAVDRVVNRADHPFDVILMDIAMPVMDGYEATKTIKAMEEPLSLIPIVGVSAHTGREDMKTMRACGMVASVAKPLDRALLRRTLEDIFSNAPENYSGGTATINTENDKSSVSPSKMLFGAEFPADLRTQLFKDLSAAKEQLETALLEKNIEEARSNLHKLKSLTGTFGHPAYQTVKEAYENLCVADSELDQPATDHISTLLQHL